MSSGSARPRSRNEIVALSANTAAGIARARAAAIRRSCSIHGILRDGVVFQALASPSFGADQLDPAGQAEPPWPAPRRRAHHAERRAVHVFDRIGQIRVAWSEKVWPHARPE